MSITGTLVPFLPQQFCDDDGVPLAGGFLTFKAAGTNTDKDTFAQADLDPDTVNDNPLELDSGGRPESAIFFEPGLYDVTIANSDEELVKTVEGVGVPEAESPVGLGLALATGSRNVTDGYTVLATDTMITVNSSGGTTGINLPAVADRTQPIFIKNLGANIVNVTPNGSDTIDGSLSTWQINASGTPHFAGVWLFPDGEGANTWWIFANGNAV